MNALVIKGKGPQLILGFDFYIRTNFWWTLLAVVWLLANQNSTYLVLLILHAIWIRLMGIWCLVQLVWIHNLIALIIFWEGCSELSQIFKKTNELFCKEGENSHSRKLISCFRSFFYSNYTIRYLPCWWVGFYSSIWID